jgi:hypothetical protein
MSSLKLDGSNDLAVENNSLVLLTDPVEETAQRLKTKFRFFLGEWAFEPRAGMPLFEKVFLKNPDLSAVRRLYSEVITSDENVDSLVSLAIGLDTTARHMTLSFEALLKDGSTLTFADFILEENR